MIDWEKHAAHRRQVIADHGRWIGLLDGNGIPICDLPSNPLELEAPQERMAIGSLRMKINVGSKWQTKHPALRALIDDTLGVTDSGAIEPTRKTRFVLIDNGGPRRPTYRCAQRGTPRLANTLTIHALDVLSYLQQIPSVSQPAKWAKPEWFTADTDWVTVGDQEKKFTTPREIREIDFSTSVLADNVLDGPADLVIAQALRESLAAVFAGIEKREVIQVAAVKPTPGVPNLSIKPSDGWLWSELAPRATAAGINITASMWLPTDPQPAGLTLDKPTIVLTVAAGKEH
ncbi:hypothetical protein VVR46_08025 [Corynebacterium phoceense]|uniref:hypothetical protein n=1 Tax=Corynebacterium phoceense TaxID=1686286 RepID=UPI0034CD6CF0